MSEAADLSEAAITLDLTDPIIFPLVPHGRRDAVKCLWTLNNRLAEMAVSGTEPALRQIRLRWWADQLALTENGTVPPEPLLADVATIVTPLLGAAALASLAEAWLDAAASVEGEPPETAQGGLIYAMTASLLGHQAHDSHAIEQAGRLWVGVRGTDRIGTTAAEDWEPWAAAAATVRLAALPRPLAALTSLARAIASRRGERRWRSEQLLILRVGLFGR
jgi:phytoene synthase